MLNVKFYRIWQVSLVLFLVSYISFSQITGSGTVLNSGPIGSGKVTSALPGKLRSIINKKVFSRINPTSLATRNNPKSISSNSKRKNSKNKTANRPIDSSGLAKSGNLLKVSNLGVIKFEPIGDTGFDEELADLLTPKPDEKEALLLIFSETKKAYQSEAEKLGRQNDLALALTFFMSTCVTAYHNTPEPTDRATDSLYQVLAESLMETPEIVQMSNQEKYLASDKLIYVSGLILAGYLSSKENNDRETLSVYRKVAGDCLEAVSGISPEKMEFNQAGLKIKP